MWQYFYLKFYNESEAAIALEGQQNVDHVGHLPDAEGWHVNLAVRGELPAELVPYQVFPTTPARVWATYIPENLPLEMPETENLENV